MTFGSQFGVNRRNRQSCVTTGQNMSRSWRFLLLFIGPFLSLTLFPFFFPSFEAWVRNCASDAFKASVSFSSLTVSGSSLSLRLSPVSKPGVVGEDQREEGGARWRRGFMEDQSDPPDAWMPSIGGGPSGQMCRICRHPCSAAVSEDLFGCLSPDVHVMIIRHVWNSGDTGGFNVRL